MKAVSRIALCLAATAAVAALPTEARVASIDNMLARRASLGLSADHGFALRNAQSDELGSHARFQQTYRGVKVFGGEVIAHADAAGRDRGVTNALYKNINLNVMPSIERSEALATAHRELAPKGTYAHEPSAELVVFPVTAQAKVGLGEGALAYRDEVVRYALAYHVHTELENGAETSHMDYLIDAHTGAILEKWSTLETAAATGSGNSQYSGNVSINTNSVSGGYEMRDVVRGMSYATYNLNHATSGQGTIYTDADNGWGDGANYVEGSSTTAANGQTAAVDAHYGVGLTYDYYKNIHGRNGIDGNGTATYSRVHYSNSYDNAFWSDSCFCMTYGDGSSFLTLTSIDVAGHEMSHGVCARTAGLTYRGESGGLNEGNSDINGTMVEFMAHGNGTTTVPNNGGNFTIGEQLATPSFNHPLRYMYKPSLDGRSPDFWSKSIGRLDVHYSSGVANHFFYLLSQGTTNLTNTSNNSSFAGIGNDHAARIWYRALSTYFTSSTNYSAARTATLSAASDLYGAASTEYATVAKAWSAVNVK